MQIYVSSVAVLLLAGAAAWFRAKMEKAVPVGYQDEDGFHTGNEPAKKEQNWPRVW